MRKLVLAVVVLASALAGPAADRPANRTAGGAGHDRSASAASAALRVSPPAATAAGTVGDAVAATGGERTGAGLATGARTLVLYDSTGAYAWLGEVYATQAANLVSHFGAWTGKPVTGYVAGELSRYTAVVYVGSTYDEPLPTAFLDDVLSTKVPILWVNDNIWQLTARDHAFAQEYGFTWRQFDRSKVAEVRYKGTSLTRYASDAGIMDNTVTDPSKAQILADAVRPDGTTFPWAIRSGRLTYVGEIPFSYESHDDRYLAFADLLFDALAPATATRHRALVRIEDVGPTANPKDLRAVADYLGQRHVPFTVAVYPEYRNPRGVDNGGKPVTKRLRDAPDVVAALKYMVDKGGTLLMHGYTHQYESKANPYTAISADDFEFFLAHVDADNYVRYDGPVPEDSPAWAGGRIDAGLAEFAAAGLARPTMFEFPHYAGSAIDYGVVNQRFGIRYDRGIYYPGLLSGRSPDPSHMVGQFFPYPVRDIYGSVVIPENLGNIAVEEDNHNPRRLPPDILASAKRNLVVRDGTASFFYHPYLGTSYLRQVVEGIQNLGYTFVPASAMATG